MPATTSEQISEMLTMLAAADEEEDKILGEVADLMGQARTRLLELRSLRKTMVKNVRSVNFKLQEAIRARTDG